MFLEFDSTHLMIFGKIFNEKSTFLPFRSFISNSEPPEGSHIRSPSSSGQASMVSRPLRIYVTAFKGCPTQYSS
jgi:hypothetical protein